VAFSRSRRRALTLSALAALTAYGLYQAGGVGNGIRGLAGGALRPFSWTVNVVAAPIGHLLAGAVNYSDLVSQNQQLRTALGQATLAASVNSGATQTLAALDAILHLPFVGSTPSVVAQVVGVSPTNFAATVTLSKGTSDGVLPGMPVVANGGVVGRVVATTNHGATVRLVTDQNSSLTVTFGKQATTVLVDGRGVNNGLAISGIPVTSSLAIGQVLRSSSLSGSTMPGGLPVAKVTSISVTPGSSTYAATVAPVADLHHLSFVDVLLWEPST
jgi:rod shape-determining protein MreC